MKKILIDGQGYYLVPVELLDEEPDVVREEILEDDLLAGYGIEPEKDLENGVEDAQPQVSGYRERFKEHRISPEEVRVSRNNFSATNNAVRSLNQANEGNFSGISSKAGYSAFYGDGVSVDLI